MNSIFSGPQVAYLLIALVVLGLAFTGIVWVGRTIRGELGSGATRGAESAGLAMLGQISPAMMKEAIAKGLVVPSQLAGMTEAERMFLFASLKQKLAAATSDSAAAPAIAPAIAPLALSERQPTRPVAPPAPVATKPPAPALLPADIPPAMLAILNAEKLRLWCALCGTELQLPTFPPLLARCTNCGNKTAVRTEEGGRYVVNISPPAK